MVAIKNLRRKTALLLAVAALALQPGCAPPGPRALLGGDELLRKGKPLEAVEKLKRATELLPGDPRAWNLLGLAYHRSGQPALAVQAYRHALAKDQSNVVAVAHYNLGCLLLEQNRAAEAADELRSYTLTTNSVGGLVKLASAQIRLRQFDAAERTITSALRLEPKNAEALNSLGVIHAHRNQRDAAQMRFTSALATNPKHSSALLNSALLAQQVPAMKPVALQRYREFLAVQPRGPQADTVKLLVRQLEAELAPAPVVAVQNVTRTNSLPATNIRSAAVVVTNQSPQIVAVKSNAVVAIAKTNQNVNVVTNKPPIPVILPVTVVAVTNEAPAKIATAPAPAPRPSNTIVSPATLPPPAIRVTTPEVSSPLVSNASEEKKPGLLARLNPFGGKTKSTTNETPRSVVLNPPAETLPDVERARALERREAMARYNYLSPVPPAKGIRLNAERALQRALDAQRAGRKSEAQLQFENALTADPSYFDAQYNAALFAFQSGDLKRALAGWETALALEPDSINARYSFALTLKQANFPRDAAAELGKIVEGKPEDARAHLALGNLYAQSLNEPAKARAHYQKVLTLDPRSPQASAIRFWLAANP
jgi:tetratricopeptide (TPR) repeat protein